MKILIACEESQTVCKAFRKRGHEAFSCDIKECSGGKPEWHIQEDVLKIINDNWDMIIAHPPCTYLSKAGTRWINEPGREEAGKKAAEFFMQFYNNKCKKICIENPVPLKKYNLPKYSQIIQPYQFNENYSKMTCLWLKGLPYLMPTCYVIGKIEHWTEIHKSATIRSKTFPGIAKAMANQWG